MIWLGRIVGVLLICAAAMVVAAYFRTPEVPTAELPADWTPGCEELQTDWTRMPTARLSGSVRTWPAWTSMWTGSDLVVPYTVDLARTAGPAVGLWRSGPSGERITERGVAAGRVWRSLARGDDLWMFVSQVTPSGTLELVHLSASTFEVKYRKTFSGHLEAVLEMPDGTTRVAWRTDQDWRLSPERFWASIDLATGSLGPIEPFPLEQTVFTFQLDRETVLARRDAGIPPVMLNLATGAVALRPTPQEVNAHWPQREAPPRWGHVQASTPLLGSYGLERDLYVVGSIPAAHTVFAEANNASYSGTADWWRHPLASARYALWRKRLGQTAYDDAVLTMRYDEVYYYAPGDSDFTPQRLGGDLPQTLQVAPDLAWNQTRGLTVLRAAVDRLLIVQTIPEVPETLSKNGLLRIGQVGDGDTEIAWHAWLPLPYPVQNPQLLRVRIRVCAAEEGVIVVTYGIPPGTTRYEVAWVEVPWPELELDVPVGMELRGF